MTIPLIQGEIFDNAEVDLSGDGFNDIILRRNYSNPYRYGVRVVNSVTGQNLYLFDDLSYSYYAAQRESDHLSWDIDNDGLNELIIKRYTADYVSGDYLVYKTNGTSTSVGQEPSGKPSNFKLNQNYPNPFNPSTKIIFLLNSTGISNLEIFDIAGRLVRNYSLSGYPTGEHSVEWDGRDNQGNTVSTGTYLYRLSTANQASAMKMILLR